LGERERIGQDVGGVKDKSRSLTLLANGASRFGMTVGA
jgi:hypothetical protein